MRLSVSLLLGLLLVSPLWAMRPLSVEDAATLGQGAWEIEEGYEMDQPKGGESLGSFGTSIKYGILSNLDLGVEVPYSASSPTGMGDAVLKGKIGLDENLAFGVDVKLANADAGSGLGSGKIDYGVNGVYSRAMGEIMAHFNVGYTIVADGDQPSEVSYGAALVYPYNNVMNLMAELAGSSTSDSSLNPLEALIGINWVANELLTLDGGAAVGLSEASSDYKATLGATLAL